MRSMAANHQFMTFSARAAISTSCPSGEDRNGGHGYGGGRGFPHSWLGWPTAGYALFVMDTRGQGSACACATSGTPVRTRPLFMA
jgi:hypothetical protein